MVRVSVRVRSGAARVKVRVVAVSVERAASIAGVSCPGEDIQLLLPAATRSSSGEERAGAASTLVEKVAI